MDEKEIRALVSLLDDEDREVSHHVEKKIISLGGDAIPFLEEEWERNFNPVVQKRIEDMIHNLQYGLLGIRLKKWADGGGENLLEGMWLVATYLYPDLRYSSLLKEIEQLYYEVWLEFTYEMHPIDQIKVFNSIFFGKLRFRANTQNFHSPANSMINTVLESRRGNHVVLCVVYLLIANKLKLPVYGVDLPSFFILTYKTSALQFYINAFNKGLIFSRADIDNYINQLKLSHSDTFYEPCSNFAIVRCTLKSLALSFEKQGDLDKNIELQRLLDTLGNYPA